MFSFSVTSKSLGNEFEFLDVIFTAMVKEKAIHLYRSVNQQVQWVRQKHNLSKNSWQRLFLIICHSRLVAGFKIVMGSEWHLCFESCQGKKTHIKCLIKVFLSDCIFFVFHSPDIARQFFRRWAFRMVFYFLLFVPS